MSLVLVPLLVPPCPPASPLVWGMSVAPPVTLIEIPWTCDKFPIFRMLLLSFGLLLWAREEENSFHRACNLSDGKRDAKGKNNLGGERKIVAV